ncbi:MAG: metallophosphoesterase [Bacteroidales bacterium]|jgi:predicted phosphodiesterase
MIIIFCSCDDLIEYSPYESDVPSENINLKEIEKINNSTVPSDTLKFALISDPHIHYDDLADAVNSINQYEGLQFIVCCGDITDRGLKQEFVWYRDIIGDSEYPVITVIGNHDYRSNGKKIYEKMFGPSNFSFVFMNYKFIAFDDVVWENNNRSPDFVWLQAELEKSDLPCILSAHIPPWSDQLEGIYNLVFREIISESNLILCIYGHQHSFSQQVFAGVPEIVSDDITTREYYIISLCGKSYKIKHMNF